MEGKFMKTFDGSDIYVYEWEDVKAPKGVVQIFHGMAEHAGRYDNFARFLNSKGYIVFADDHRAHGKTAKSIDKIGKYKDTNLFFDTIKDEIFFSNFLKNKYNLPLYVFGHSYGSFLCQAYIENYDGYDKAIICGSALMKNRMDIAFGLMVSKITKHFKGGDAPAKLVEKLSFATYDKKVGTGSWLNTIQEEVDKYRADERCGRTFSVNFYISMFEAFTKNIYKKENVEKINKDKPLLLIAGSCDPVGNMGKSMKKLFNFYKKNNLKDVRLKLYEGARHEILNDFTRSKVYSDIVDFLSK